MTQRFTCFMLTAILLLCASNVLALEVGDPAPPVSVTDWVKGKPMDVLTDGKGKVIMLEFWATWCPPCIQIIPETTALYQTYKDQGLIVVGLTDMGRGQTLKQVREFVSKQGSRMDYPVAFDSMQRTTMAYQAFGLPHAVIIGKDGKIAWMGHPATPEMKQIVDDMLHDRYDAEAAARQAAINQMLGQMANELYVYMQQGRAEDALGVTERMLQADPANFEAMQYRILIYIDQIKSIDRMREWVNQFLEKHKADAGALAKAAQLMMAIPDITQRQPDLAVKAARMAADAEPDSRDIMQAVALTYYEVGDLATAMSYQQKAVGLAKEPETIEEAKAVLTFFENCQKQHVSTDAPN